jgi:phosphatidate phosphatase APP1
MKYKIYRTYYRLLRFFIDKTFPAIPFFYRDFPKADSIKDQELKSKIEDLLESGDRALEKWENENPY